METKFQTSFIPKKSLMMQGGIGGISAQAPRHRSSSIFMTLAVLIFIASLCIAGGTYFWKSLALQSQESYKTQLAQREKQFNANLIEELKRQNVKIDFARQLLRNHLALSQIFGIIGLFTAIGVLRLTAN